MVAENENLLVVVGEGNLLGKIFPSRAMRKFLASGWTHPTRKTLSIVATSQLVLETLENLFSILI